jgi:hypothetical protein
VKLLIFGGSVSLEKDFFDGKKVEIVLNNKHTILL